MNSISNYIVKVYSNTPHVRMSRSEIISNYCEFSYIRTPLYVTILKRLYRGVIFNSIYFLEGVYMIRYETNY